MQKQSSEQSINKAKRVEKIGTWSLWIVSGIALLIAVVSFYTPFFDWLSSVVPPFRSLNLTALVLLIFSLIGIAIGWERREAFEETRIRAQGRHEEVIWAIGQMQKTVEQDNQDLEEEIAEVHRTLTTAISCKALIGHKAVYEEAARLLRSCKGSEIIRTTSLGANFRDDSSGEAPYSTYLETLAKKIGEVKQQGAGMVYQVVMGFRLNEKGEPPLNKQWGILGRRKLFKQYNALDRLQIKYLDTSWSLDLLIVGDEQLIIGLPTIAGDREIRLGLRVTDKDFVGHTVRWYNEHLWNEAKPLTWTSEET